MPKFARSHHTIALAIEITRHENVCNDEMVIVAVLLVTRNAQQNFLVDGISDTNQMCD